MIERLWLFHCGFIPVPRPLFEKGAGWDFPKLPFMGALAEHSELGPILIDAPFGHEGPANVGRLTAGVLKTVGLRFRARWATVPRIEEMGFRPSEVQHALMTHMHVDHTGGMKTLGRTTFHVSEEEWGFAREVSPTLAAAKGYAPDDYTGLRKRIETFAAPPAIDDSARASRSDSALGHDVFDDGSVRAVSLPGHSPGHTGYLFEMSDGRQIFHVGDAAFTLPHITERRTLGRFPKTFAWEFGRAEETLRGLRLFHEEHPEVEFVNSHDFELFEECKARPAEI